MYVFFKSLFTLIGILAVLAVGFAFWTDFQRMDPTNNFYPKGDGKVLRGEPVSFDSIDATPEGFARRGFLMDLLLECRTGRLSLELFQWRLDLGKMSEEDVRLHNPQAACQKRGLQTLF